MNSNGLIKGLITLLILFCFNLVFSQQSPEHQIYKCKHRKQAGLTDQNTAFSYKYQADNSRSDTIDILNYTINLDITDFTNQIIKGNCEITFTAKMNNINTLSLDLLQMNIDSIISNNVSLPYSYDDTLVIVSLPGTLNTGDTSGITVYYNGQPQGDPSGWGGFYFMGVYAFNLGVGFDANPHNYGRVWFPCFDNFVERSSYEFNIITAGGKKAVCNGELINEVTLLGDTIMRTWQMNYEIPTYLVCVAVADYVVVNQVHNGISGAIPIQLFARAGDTTALKNSFINLGGAIDAFENSYGAYQWNKVGYSLIPFNSGAMEHATNIAYGRAFADGTLIYEDLMAHELSHQWWGNLATCETAEDMWLNEGMAVYSEFLFWENVYDKDTYIQTVRDNHEYILHLAHITENGYRAISGIPHQYTYGDHVYLKGADVVHTLRGYLGDSLFFNGLTTFLANNQFTNINSYDLRDQLTAITGVDLTDFFDKWVFNPGFPHFSIDSLQVVPDTIGGYIATVYIKQKLTGAPAYYNNVPLEITFMDANWNKRKEQIIMSGKNTVFTFEYGFPQSFLPVYAALNMDSKISDAISSETKAINSTGSYTFANARMNINVSAITDSAFIRIEHNWTAPDPIATTTIYKLSPNRYWKIDGILPAIFSASAQMFYDGKESGSSYLDHLLITDTLSEDSLVLLYRRKAADNWYEYEYYTKNTFGNPNDKFGLIEIDSLLLGEYVFAMKGNVFVNSTVITALTNISCNGNCDGNATVTATGGSPPYTYLWDDLASQITTTATGLCAGTYTIMVIDTVGDTAYATVTITEPFILSGIITSTDETCNGCADGTASVSIMGGTPPYTYQWNDPSNQTTSTATGLIKNTYTVIVTDANGCVFFDTIGLSLNMEELFDVRNEIRIFPNPTSDSFVIKTTNANGFESGAVLKVTDISGRTVYQKRLGKNNSQLSVKTKGWEDGIYLVSINDGGHILFRDKLVVMR